MLQVLIYATGSKCIIIFRSEFLYRAHTRSKLKASLELMSCSSAWTSNSKSNGEAGRESIYHKSGSQAILLMTLGSNQSSKLSRLPFSQKFGSMEMFSNILMGRKPLSAVANHVQVHGDELDVSGV